MHRYRVIFGRRVAGDLEDIHTYIAQSSVENASKVISRILEAFKKLRTTPNRTKVGIRNLEVSGVLRKVVVEPYVVYYFTSEEHRLVRIARVWHGSRQKPRAADLI